MIYLGSAALRSEGCAVVVDSKLFLSFRACMMRVCNMVLTSTEKCFRKIGIRLEILKAGISLQLIGLFHSDGMYGVQGKRFHTADMLFALFFSFGDMGDEYTEYEELTMVYGFSLSKYLKYIGKME